MNIIKVGIACLIRRNDNTILLGKRKGAHGAQTWAPPGGHLEFKEDPVACAIRETKEETGIDIVNVKPGPCTNDFFTEENKHYITLFMLANYQSGNPQVLEPEKCEKWDWFSWLSLPEPLFLPLNNLLTSIPFNPAS